MVKTGGAVIATGAVTGATLAGDGSAITALNGTNIASGTVAAARVATLNQKYNRKCGDINNCKSNCT